jgi:fatty-acyl-CoA synthase
VYEEPGGALSLRWRYDDLREEVQRAARGLVCLGVGHGEKVAVLTTNVPEWIVLELAIATIGATLVTVNPNSQAAELAHVLRQADVKVLVLMDRYRELDHVAALQQLLPELAAHRDAAPATIDSPAFPELRHLVLLRSAHRPGFASLGEVVRQGGDVDGATFDARRRRVTPADIFQIQFTSGTAGVPKGAMISHHSAVNNARLFAQRVGFRTGDRLLTSMPLFHTAGGIMELLGGSPTAAPSSRR